MPSETRITTGSFDFSAGVDSGRAPTIAGPANPNGLKPNQLAWANNCSLRQGGISPRGGWEFLTAMPTVAAYQGAYMYEPPGEFPYIIVSIGGRIWRVRVDTDNSIDEITQGFNNPPDVDYGYMVQGEQFLVIQAGDFETLPLFWDGETMRRSLGSSQSLGVTSANFTVPAVGDIVLVTLTAPYAGQQGQTMLINGKTYQQTNPTTVAVIRNGNDIQGTVFPAGTRIFEADAVTLIGVLGEQFIAPAPGVDSNVIIVPVPGGAMPRGIRLEKSGFVSPAGPLWSLQSVGFPPAGANQVYLINLTDTPGATVNAPATLYSMPELPAAGPMDYYMGRIWEASGRQYLAGDIVRGPSGTTQYELTDSILKITENLYLTSGGVFTVPTNAGNIRAMSHPANLDTALGEGQLLPFTRRNIYSVNVVPTRVEWVNLREPIQRVAQINFGTTSDRSVAAVNGDLFYQSVDGVRSLQQAIRYFQQWGNVPISHEVQRATSQNNKALLRFGTGIEFDNRLLQSCLPFEVPVGVAHPGVLSLNFDLLNSIGEKLPPAWEGLWQGLNILQLLKGDFGGRQRAFAFIWSDLNSRIELWELTTDAPRDRISDGTPARIEWSFETPAYTWGDPFALKELDTMELWVDRLIGTVEFTVEFRPGQYPCWLFWHHWAECSARDTCELPNPLMPCNYPEQPFLPQYRIPMVLPKPPASCNDNVKRPMNIDGQFQFRISIKGNCRVRGILVHALPRERAPYEGIVCTDPGLLADTPKRIL